MSHEGLLALKVCPLRTRALRRAVMAPDLERYLSMRKVDFAMTDQLEALQVRVRRGVEVLEGRIVRGIETSRRLLITWSVTAGVLLGAVVCSIHVPAFAAALTICCVLSMVPLGRVIQDAFQLRTLKGRYAGFVELARTREQLVDFAESALREARELGAAATSPADPSAARLP